ncbi:amidohydrolase family protein [Ruania zhangjianzhongii]|uniref:amidohydrolase family protein n=1 Tax=Ruania zhangjianzhongii TaxID=2603206 RepID=UPI0011C844AF|nr:amidohydrolase family protein [Ruania zhangjianzhongii]
MPFAEAPFAETPVIDAHAHVWHRASTPQPWIDSGTMAAIDRDFSLADLTDLREECGLAGTVLVQSAHSPAETLALCAAVDHRSVLGAVGWVDLRADVPAQLAGIDARSPGALVGIRHLSHQDPDPEALLSLAAGIAALGSAGLAVDLVLRPDQLDQAVTLADRHPQVRFVLDHLGNPPILDSAALARWQATVTALARRENVVAKLSGITMGAEHATWTPADLEPVVATALAAFGPDRLLLGTDWPVVRLTGGAGRWLAAVAELITPLAPAERAAILAGTAQRTYRLGANTAHRNRT